jgi:hypothetical protein
LYAALPGEVSLVAERAAYPKEQVTSPGDTGEGVTLADMSGRTTNVGGVISLLGAFLAAAVITGFLSAGLFMPVVGAVGGSVRTVVDLFDALPDSFTTSPLCGAVGHPGG